MFNWFGKKSTGTITPEAQEAPVAELSPLSSIKAAVATTGKSIVGKIFGLLKDSEINDDLIDEIEEILIRADVGLETATGITDRLRKRKHELGSPEQLMN